MGLLQKLKSVLGLDGSRQPPRNAETDVTVEREPSAESERAVKGVGATAGGSTDAGSGETPRAPQSANSTGAAEADADASTQEPTETDADEPAVPEAEPEAATEGATDATAGQTESSPGTETADKTDESPPEIETGESPEETETGESPEETETGESPEETETGESPDVQEINGIGPTYADRLGKAGYETVADLAGSDPDAVADAAETSPSRAEDWIDQAEQF